MIFTFNGLNGDPKRCVPLEPVNKIVSGKRVFVDAFKDGEVKSSWVWVALNPISRFLVRDKRVKQKESQFNRSSPYQKFLKRKQVKKKGELSKK